MKKLILFSLLTFTFSFFPVLCDAQFNVYHPFPNNNARWGIVFKNNVSQFNYYNYYLRGDTIVNSKTYAILDKSGGYGFPVGGWQSFDSIACLLREDTAAKQIYISFKPFTKDTLLYDFNLNVGDTLPQTYINVPHCEYVSSVDSILIGTHYRKQFIIKFKIYLPGYLDSLIEGIGSAQGLLERTPWFEIYSQLLCFSQNDTTVYPYLNDSCTKFILSTPNIQKSVNSISVYPNPSSGNYEFQITNYELGKLNVEVYNVLGERVYSQFKIQNSKFKIDMQSQPNGIYLYRIISENGNLIGTGKLIIQK